MIDHIISPSLLYQSQMITHNHIKIKGGKSSKTKYLMKKSTLQK